MTIKETGLPRRRGGVPYNGCRMTKTDVEIIESTAGQITAELARRGIDPARLVTVTVERKTG